MKKTKLYNLVYKINGIIIETVMTQKPIALVKWEKKLLENTTYSLGKLKVV